MDIAQVACPPPGDRVKFVLEGGGIVRLVAKRGFVKCLKSMISGPSDFVFVESVDKAFREVAGDT